MPYRRRERTRYHTSHSSDQRWFRCPKCSAKIKGAGQYRIHSDTHPRRPDLEKEEIIVDESKW